MNNYSNYTKYFSLYTTLSYFDVLCSVPIYIYTIFYMSTRAARHIKRYRYVILVNVVWNFIFENVMSGLAIVWFADFKVACPTGWMRHLRIDPTVWKSFVSCLSHALSVSIAHLYFHRLKSAIWPSRYYYTLDEFGTATFVGFYVFGFLVYPYIIYHVEATGDRVLHSVNLTGLPEYFWSDDCYVTEKHNNDVYSQNLLFAVSLFTTILLYAMIVVTIFVIVRTYRSQMTRKAILQRKLLFGLVVQTIIFVIMYLIPTQIRKVSYALSIFNPAFVQFSGILIQFHGSCMVVSMLLTNSSFRQDLVDRLLLKKRSNVSIQHIRSYQGQIVG